MPSQPPTISPPPLKRRRLSSTPRSPSDLPPARVRELPSATTSLLRIYSWNVNGIGSFLPPSTPSITNYFSRNTKSSSPPTQPSLRTNLRRWKWPHVLVLQEVKIAPTDEKTQATLRRIVNASLDSTDEGRYLYDAHFSLPRDKHNATGFGGKVYGVCTLLRRDVPNVRVKDVSWDLEGRVLLAEISQYGLVIVNVYAVNGTMNDYRDPNTGKVIGDRHGRKKVFHSLLRDEAKQYEKQGWRVVIAGDINISRSSMDSFPQLRLAKEHVENRADFEEKFIRDLKMIDTFRMIKGEERKYSYRPTGKPWGAGGDRVDMILVSEGLKKLVEDADILDTQDERGPSDHVPLLVELAATQVEEVERIADNDASMTDDG